MRYYVAVVLRGRWALRYAAFGLLGLLGLAGIVLLVWRVPAALYTYVPEPKDRAAAEASTRTGLVAGLAGLGALGSLAIANRTYRLTQQGQLNDRYVKAIEQFGSDKLNVRLGGIYALERILAEFRSGPELGPLIEVLSAFVREESSKSAGSDADVADETEQRRPAADVVAAVTVLGRAPKRTGLSRGDLTGARIAGISLPSADFSGARLSSADLSDAELSGADLSRADVLGTNLSRALLYEANLTGARLFGADLSRALLYGANLSETDLTRTNLIGADLNRAKLSHALLREANLADVRLSEADLSGAVLDRAKLSDAVLDRVTEVRAFGRQRRDRLRSGYVGSLSAAASRWTTPMTKESENRSAERPPREDFGHIGALNVRRDHRRQTNPLATRADRPGGPAPARWWQPAATMTGRLIALLAWGGSQV